jgi:hypothetical protein
MLFPRIGYAICAGLLGDDEAAIASMHDALSLDAESMQYVPADDRLEPILGDLASRYDERARSTYGDLDALFMVAAVRTLRGEYAAAAYALDVAVTLGDDSQSTIALQALVEAAVRGSIH